MKIRLSKETAGFSLNFIKQTEQFKFSTKIYKLY
jgi:hypothetical protein